MRQLPFFLWLLLAFFLVNSVYADSPLRKSTNYYFVAGTSALILMQQFSKKGPVGRDGKNYIYRAQWDVQWKIKFLERDHSCRPKEVSVIVGMNATYPKWNNFSNASKKLKMRWEKMFIAIKKHEKFHEEHAVLAAEKIKNTILAFKQEDSCRLVEQKATNVGRKIMSTYQKMSEAYDIETQYGQSIGITLL